MRANKIAAIISGVYESKELLPLTENRPLSTLPFDCKYRILDFSLSNAVNANIKQVYMIFNQHQTKSVFDHIGGGREWHLDSVDSRFFINFYQEYLQKKAEGLPYYDDAIDFLNKSKSEYTVFMGNRMLCNIDIESVLKIHQQKDVDLTVVYKKMSKEYISAKDVILKIDDGHVIGYDRFENNRLEDELHNLSMTIFICRTDWLIRQFQEGQLNNSPASMQEFLMDRMNQVRTSAYEYTGFLSNIFDVKSYYDANMAMLDSKKFNSLLYTSQKIYTKLKNEVATYYAPTSVVNNSQFATGCIIEGKVENSLFSRKTFVAKDAEVYDSIVMANVKIQENAFIKNAIVDKNVIIEPGVKIIGTAEKPVVVRKNAHVLNDIYGGEH
ncbi:glucose-1-phosphate adenylyltransferase subunit GlgD [Enterococcus alishanensis]|uniref:Glucose-1-phosphate adenylyltransferase subunit GlgD n=1 Tax=Enterococcus alishanensis TaxID=1303817 RepID=A0ABS6TAZ3_9ENTE|nr:glucose-1-phosphate adenylyltransferase subunit GlgD [Enterococcus alishanensis]MBV7390072.1 glucose-1-phosphate adenylyltransferase subunit GlgD [Enterococcus alishanensis]